MISGVSIGDDLRVADESQKAMMEPAQVSNICKNQVDENPPFEGNLMASGRYENEETLQVPAVKQLVTTLSNIPERAGFEPAVPPKGTPVFETGSIGHSDTSPRFIIAGIIVHYYTSNRKVGKSKTSDKNSAARIFHHN